MRARLVGWGLAVIAGLTVAMMTPETLFPGSRLFALMATIFLAWIVSRGVIQPGASTPRPRDERFPDGKVEIAGMVGFLGEPNPTDPRFSRFLGLEPPSGDKPRGVPRETRIANRCPSLLGRIVIFSVFLDRDRSIWSADEIARSHQAILRAGVWMEQQALRWNARMNVEVSTTYFVAREEAGRDIEIEFQYEGNALNAFEKDEARNTFANLNSAAIELRFHHAVEFIEAIEARVEADRAVWLIHPRMAGRSFALPVDSMFGSPVHLAVCYPVYSDLPESFLGPAAADPVTVIHEILHLFGASDKYNQSFRAFEPGSVTRADVMRLDEDRLGRLRVDRQTAREVGWIRLGSSATKETRRRLPMSGRRRRVVMTSRQRRVSLTRLQDGIGQAG
jgi:hypothetical protein